jgi:hypothetical protein
VQAVLAAVVADDVGDGDPSPWGRRSAVAGLVALGLALAALVASATLGG